MKTGAINQYDELITQAARGMTEIDAPASFRAGVMAKLGRQSAPVAWPRVAMALGAAAMLLLAIWLPRSAKVGAPAVEPPQQAASGAGQVPSVAPVIAVVATRDRQSPRTPAMSAEELAWLGRSIVPLAGPDGLVMAEIQPKAASIAPIVVEPLDTTPIEIAVLDPRSGGRH